MNANPAITPRPHPEVAWELFDTDGFEIVVFDGRTGRARRLNPSASAVWFLCDGSLAEAEIAAELADTFGLSPDDAVRAVADALHDFATAGWLDGSGMPAPAAVRATDSLLPRPPDPCGVDTARYGWVTTLHLQIGEWSVGVRAGSKRIAARLSERFGEWLVDHDGTARTNFSVRRTGWLSGYEVMVAGVRVARVRRLDQAVEVVDRLLGGVAVFGQEPDGLISVDIGLLVNDGRAILVDVDGLKCTDRRYALDLLEGAIPTWRVLVNARGPDVLIPSPLTSPREPEHWDRVVLVGAVLTTDLRGATAERRLYGMADAEHAAWVDVIDMLAGQLAAYSDEASGREAVAKLLGAGAAREASG